jgi:SAM-dependent methyltransferase
MGSPFTGEFLVPGDPRFAVDIVQHLVPYLYCAQRVAGRLVAEIGCGAGYGAKELASAAREVHAWDRNRQAVSWARDHYAADNLSFRLEGEDPPPEPGLYDAVCSFQVIEHLEDPRPFLAGLRGLLADGGALYLTTPNRMTSAGENIYHVHEYEPQELQALLQEEFGRVTLLGISGDERYRTYQARRHAAMARFLRLDPLGLRRFLPRRLLAPVFPILARAVRGRAVAPDSSLKIRVEDFQVNADDLERSDDLFALCER